MSLRSRLALVLAAVLVGPLLAAWAAIGVLVPHAASAAAASALDRAAASAAGYLGAQCLGLGDAARAVAATLGPDSSAQPSRAAAAVDGVVARRPGSSAFVLRPGALVAAAGSLAGRLSAADVEALGQASCARRTAPATLVALVESVPVTDPAGATVARAVVVQPLDASALVAVRDALRLGADLTLVPGTGTPGGTPVSTAGTVSTAGPGSSQFGAVLPAVTGPSLRHTSGEAGEWRFHVDPAAAGVPYRVVVTSHIDSSRLQLVLLAAVLAFSAVFTGLLLVLTGRLTGPLAALTRTAQRLGRGDLDARSGITGTDEVGTLAVALDSMAGELQATIEELGARQQALADTFERFGEALGQTHDLDGLLRTVVEAACRGASASAGTVLLADQSVEDVADAPVLEERVSSAPDGADPVWVAATLDALAPLAARAVETGDVLASDHAVAAPLLRGDEVVGALAVARRPEGPALDDAALAAVTALAAHAGTAVANVREHQTAQRLSVTDPLTGAANFRQLSTTLSREVERASRFNRPLSVLMLDLDHFKQVNDSHGHAFGDAVLREFARRLQACLREVDLVARYGGEEFAVVLPETGPEGAAAVATRVVEAVRGEIFSSADQQRNVTVSVGIAAYPDHGRSASEILRSADSALYVAKRGGRNRWVMAESTRELSPFATNAEEPGPRDGERPDRLDAGRRNPAASSASTPS